MQYIPKYVRQESDLAYGEKVTHENFNEKLNLNTTQGDYNTDVLNALFNNTDIESTYRIAYIDALLEDQNERIETVEHEMEDFALEFENISDAFEQVETDMTNIIQGETVVAHATVADNITGATTIGPNKYYGTDANAVPGFITLPEFIYAEDIVSSASVEGIYFIPMLNSVAENMLTAEVREKLNREAITDYVYLDNKPQINSVTLTGNKSLSDLGIQPVGSYVTTSSLNTTLGSYYTKTQTDTAISNAVAGKATETWVNNRLSSYATTSTVNSVSSVANAAAVVRVGSSWGSGTPKNGDILITL